MKKKDCCNSGNRAYKNSGSTLDAPDFLSQLAESIKGIAANFFPIIVHGAARTSPASSICRNKEYSFVEGMRVTDEHTVGIIQMVLSGDVNKRIVKRSAKPPASTALASAGSIAGS